MNADPAPTSRDLQRMETFMRVYDAALEEFGRVGVQDAKVSEICLRAGVAKGTFFFHFPTKDHVLLERQRRISAAMAKRIDEELARTTDIASFLAGLTSVVLEEHRIIGNQELTREINLALVRHSGTAGMTTDKTAFGIALIAQVKRLQRVGAIRADIDTYELADTLRLSFWGFLLAPSSPVETRPRLAMLTSLLAGSLAV
ncbi:MAG: putative transcriptional regulator, TetR family [Hydrocarboniphaga sp.]|nr:putative transcriptional regulator, TetR family [Hydrocarboniphaga sp.]